MLDELEPTEEQLRYEEAIVRANVEKDDEEKILIDKQYEYAGKRRKKD